MQTGEITEVKEVKEEEKPKVVDLAEVVNNYMENNGLLMEVIKNMFMRIQALENK